MDDPNHPPQVRYRPDLRYTVGVAVGAVAALSAFALGGDRPGRLLAAIAAVVLTLYVVGDLVFTPRLVADAAGLRIWSPLTRAQLTWPQVESVRADSRIRLGIRATTLEIDAGEVLAVLSRRALGADPAQVADLLNAFRRPSPPA